MANRRQKLARRRFVAQSSTGAVGTSKASEGPPETRKRHRDGDGEMETKTKMKTKTKKRKTETERDPPLGEGEGEGEEGVRGEKKKKVVEEKRKKKHPLRMPGNRPGESCFVCKASDHVAKECPQRLGKDSNKICLFCRGKGHTMKFCPRKQVDEQKICYNCGEASHRLSMCPKPLKKGGTSFAECFVCKQHGHISKNCPSNTHGIYPKGGSCKLCGEVTHLAKDCLAKDCPSKGSGKRQKLNGTEPAQLMPNKHTVFRSGDDLEDDFAGDSGSDTVANGADVVVEEASLNPVNFESLLKLKKNKTEKKHGNEDSRLGEMSKPHAKSLTKQMPKVVNFK